MEAAIIDNNDVATTYSGIPCNGLPVGLHSSPDCSEFYSCTSNGQFFKTACPEGLKFNVHTQLCDWAHKVQCQSHLAYTVEQPILKSAWVRPYKKDRSNEKHVLCYYSSWAPDRKGKGHFVPENVDASLCSHVFYTFASMDTATLEMEPSFEKLDVSDRTYI